jgi:predicted component of type VI protein secretion system
MLFRLDQEKKLGWTTWLASPQRMKFVDLISDFRKRNN